MFCFPFQKEVQRQMEYLLEEYLFSDDDIRLNSETLLWPRTIDPIFDVNDEVRDDIISIKTRLFFQ